MIRVVLLIVFLVTACASDDRKLVLEGDVAPATEKCGTQSFLNRYANYRCASLELENSNQYVNQQTPIHNIKNIVSTAEQRLLVVDEKIFGAQVRTQDQEVLCKRRLKVVLNPGVGRSSNYQKGWITFKPQCFRFYRMKPSAKQNNINNFISRKNKRSRLL